MIISNDRLDKVLVKNFGERSRSYFQKLIENGLVLVNGGKAKKSLKLKESDDVEIFFQESEEISLEAEDIPLDILYEDDDLLAINKPAGMVVHPACGNWTHTFVNALLFHCKNLHKTGLRPGIVHRLDKNTSGVLIAAKNSFAQEKLIGAFQERRVEKKYLSICIGTPPEGLFSAPIGRHHSKRTEMTITSFGKEAISIFQILARSDPLSLVMTKILTGRTHQIRVHLKHLSAPILGDEVYGNSRMNRELNVKRQLLHAYQLKIFHPRTQKEILITAPLPDDFLEMLQNKNLFSTIGFNGLFLNLNRGSEYERIC